MVVTPQPELVKVQPGQTLSGIAYAYHVPMQAIAQANHLPPPYRIEVGRTLIIPPADQATAQPPPTSFAALPPPPRPSEVTGLKRPEAAISSDHLAPPAGEPSVATATPRPSTVPTAASPAAETPRPDIKPAAAPLQPAGTTELPAPTPPAPSTETAGGDFLWPVKGRILAGYGSGRDGTHNDGINIAAPRGAAIDAADGGVVAYAGNELRGYGNLILVKHRNGWISAYAHCDLILVKRGDKVARGQTIARVGSTGNVAEPQLHFELRRGNHAVDPREFLGPLPTAGTERGPPRS